MDGAGRGVARALAAGLNLRKPTDRLPSAEWLSMIRIYTSEEREAVDASKRDRSVSASCDLIIDRFKRFKLQATLLRTPES